MEHFHIGIVPILSKICYLFLLNIIFQRQHFCQIVHHVLEFRHAFLNRIRSGRTQLSAVISIHLESVVFPRIVGSGNHYTAGSSVMADSEREHRNRAQPIGEVYFYPFACQHPGRNFSKIFGMVPRIVTHDNPFFGSIRSLKACRQSFSGGRNGVDVDSIGTGTHHCAKACRTKSKIFTESFRNIFRRAYNIQ